MRLVKRLMRIFLSMLVVVIGAGIVWLYAVPPELLRVGSGYAAKIVCSNVFIAHRPEAEVLADDVQAPGHPLLRLMRVSVDGEALRVRTALIGDIAPSEAVYRPGLGCSVQPSGSRTAAIAAPPSPRASPETASRTWPDGEAVTPLDPVAAVLARPDLTGSGMRAVVVVKDGRIVAEVYGEGFDRDTPLLGWSMTKTVNASLIGRMIRDGRMTLEDSGLMPQWRQDARREIELRHLLAMESGLAFNEEYGSVADVTRMLYLEPDMAKFVAALPLAEKPGERFGYSSGTAVLLSRLWMDRLQDPARALGYPREALFGPLGMRSAVMEPDAAGTVVGSSYMYATARDWARFGLFLAQDGVWQGQRLLPEGFVSQMGEGTVASGGIYSKMQTWLPRPNERHLLPADTFSLEGHDGQSVTVMRSERMVVVRLGLSPWWARYRPAALIAELLNAVAG
ncbi:serine hydrolase [Rhizobium sp. 0TCS1.26]|uniref:serine hydrolase domain-containing protein n=1 Tax=Rhizobium sp. 0TCS1.26 TaxID=3142623 RepID=UPI003D28CCB3